MPLYPFQVLRARERALTPYLSVVFCLGFIFEFLKELGPRHIMHTNNKWSILSLDIDCHPISHALENAYPINIETNQH
jgi:hypothetical protein